MKKRTLIFNALVVLAITLLSICFTEKQFQNDTYYTIAIGQDIIENGVDMIDHHSIHDISYTYPHWLFDLIVALIYNIAGFDALYIFNIIVYIFTILLLYFVTLDISKNHFLSAVLSFTSLLFMRNFIVVRGQMISYLVFITEIFLIERYIKNNNWKYLIPLPILSIIIVNVHCAVWPMYFILFLPAIGEWFVSFYYHCQFKLGKLYKEKDKFLLLDKTNLVERLTLQDVNIKPLLLTLILSIPTGLVSANGITSYVYIYKTMIGTTTAYITEHAPSVIWGNVSFMFILVLIFAALFVFKNKFKLRDFFLIMGVLVLALSSQRHKSFLIIMSTIVFARYFAQIMNKDIDYPIFGLLEKKIIIAICTIGLFIGSAGLYYYNQYSTNYVATQAYPQEPCDWILENLDVENLRMYNEYAMGPYILYRGIPVFIDTRADLYTCEFNGLDRDIFNDMVNFNENYIDIFEYYDLDYALVRIRYLDGFNNSYQILTVDERFEQIYNDGYFAIFQYNN